MSIPKGKTSFFGRFDNPEKFRLIPQAGIRIRIDPAGTGYPSCWDMNVSQETGVLYFSPCDETGRGAHTRLCCYDYDSDTSKVCTELERYTLPRERHMPHSKLHESITCLPNGHIIASTHSTDRGKFQPEWMPFAHVDHVWDGFPGSYVIDYDPATGITRNLGMPVPRESIYGMTYDARHNCLYMIGFMRGHVYRFSLDNRSVKDLGKAAEVFCYRLHRGPDGHIYGMTKSGFLWRANVDTQQLEDMGWRLPAQEHNYTNNTWYRYLSQAQNVSDHEFVFTSDCHNNFYLFDTNTCKVRDLGRCHDFDFESDFNTASYGMNELEVDQYGVLWYYVAPQTAGPQYDDFYKYPRSLVMMRWDYRAGKKPEVMGLIGTQEEALVRITCISLDRPRDRLYFIGELREVKGDRADRPNKSRQGIFMIDLAQMRNLPAPGPLWERDMSIFPFSDDEKKAALERAEKYNSYAGEEVAGENPVTAFPISKVTPIRLWRALAGGRVEDAEVNGIAWDGEKLCGVSGENGERKYYFELSPRGPLVFPSGKEADRDETVWVWRSILQKSIIEKSTDAGYEVYPPTSFAYELTKFIPYTEIPVGRKKWLDANLYPKAYDVDENLKLPEVAGRRYLAKASACIDFSDNRQIIGTKDGLLCIAKYGNVFNLGNAAPLGPVRCLCTNADGTVLYGTAGDIEDMGTVFTYDDRSGLRQLGVISYNSHGWMDGPTAAHVLTCCALSPDGKYLAVGNADRLGCVHLFRIED